MRISSFLPLILLFLLGVTNSQAQTLKQYLRAADEAFESQNYWYALQNYREALLFDSLQWDAVWKAGESANGLYAYETAEEYYRLLRANDLVDSFPLLDVRLGIQNKRLRDYEAAVGYFKRFLNAYKQGDPYFINKAQFEIEACEWANTNLDTISGFELDALDDMVNTTASETGGVEWNDALYYASLNYLKEEDDFNPTRTIAKVLKYKKDGMSTLLPEPFNDANKYTSNVAFSPDYKRIYFTHCNYVDQAEIQCNIYYRDIVNDSTFGELVRLPDKINVPDASTTQPNIGIDPVTGLEVLYYVSDRPDGQGRLDIWYSMIDEKGNFSDPRNLAVANTFDDDVSPFYHRESHTLYFSSMGHKGYGAHDVFEVSQESGVWDTVMNVGKPVNSAYNDLHFSLDKRKARGYLTSNRPGSKLLNADLQACCFDIYEVRAVTLRELIKLVTYEEQPLPYQLNLNRYERSSLQISRIEDPSNGLVEMPGIEQTGNLVYIPNPGFVGPDRMMLIKCFDDSSTLCDTTEFEITVLPMPVDTIELTTPMNKPKKHCYDISAFDNQVNLTRSICREPSYGKAELIEGNCMNYKPMKDFIGIDTVCVKICDSTGFCIKKIYVIDVLPPTTLEGLLPMALYFDNDEPDPNTRKVTTDLNYLETADAFLNRRDEFISSFIAPLTGAERAKARSRIDSFFTNAVRAGKDSLIIFSDVLVQYMRFDQKVEIILKGYTSPRFSPEYNFNLARRRINSAKNHFYTYRDGIFLPFIESGQLIISEKPFGETRAPEGVIDDLDDVRNSVYSVEASRERRLELIEVKR